MKTARGSCCWSRTSADTPTCCELISRAQLRGSKRDARLRLEDFDGRNDGLDRALRRRVRTRRARAARGDDAAAAATRGGCASFSRPLLSRAAAPSHGPGDAALRTARCGSRATCGLPYVATNGVAYADKDDARLADVLCLREGRHDAGRSASRQPAASERRVRPQNAGRHGRLFARYPEAIARTLAIAQRCRFRLERLTGQFPLFPVPEGSAPQRYLRELVYEGAAKRYRCRSTSRRRAAARVRARHHRADGSGRLLLDRVGHRARSARARRALPRARLGGQLGGLLRARDHRRRSDRR